MASITMYDAVDTAQIPADAQAVGGYVDGNWQTFPSLGTSWPHAQHLSIAVSAADDADCLDIETGDATPADAAGWYERQKARGISRPCLYANASTMDSGVIPAMKAAGIDRAAVRLWSAHFTGTAHICGPASCGEMSIDADGTQWTDQALSRSLDESLLLADFFGTTPEPAPAPAPSPAPVPADWQEIVMNRLPVVQLGDQDHPDQVQWVSRVQGLCSATRIEGAAATMDGDFGQATKTAVEAVQRAKKIAVDGTVGPVTWSVLVSGSAP